MDPNKNDITANRAAALVDILINPKAPASDKSNFFII
jgi:hypothetical protein